MTRPKKIHNPLDAVREHLESGNYIFTIHALERLRQRNITDVETIDILVNGWHEKRKDKFDEVYEAWNYSIRGTTREESRDLRIIISFDGPMLIITVIDLNQ